MHMYYVCVCTRIFVHTFHGQNNELINSSDRRIQVEVVAVDGRVDVHFRRQSQLGDDVIE